MFHFNLFTIGYTPQYIGFAVAEIRLFNNYESALLGLSFFNVLKRESVLINILWFNVKVDFNNRVQHIFFKRR